MEAVRITTPLTGEAVAGLRAGQRVLITGRILTARDAAHKKLIELLDQGADLPVDITNQIIYYVGPSPPRPGQVVGAAGPTTAGRMDFYAPQLIALGLKGMIGKGFRSTAVTEAMQKHGAVYFAAVGGAGALLAQRIRAVRVLAYPELGPEAIYEFEVEDFPVIVANDMYGGDLYREGRRQYALDKGEDAYA
ncbi:MAG: Fe-S-containing hydro-lyase [Clostridia bacterium]|nr:Fe-S-containing hydro-lyase [Clostridia bacterium]MDQ7791787.1 Fe-S-containing hydro-lyase [Clostridia bacterium]